MNVVHLVSNPVWGGGERYVLDLALAQRADGHRVQVFTRRKPAVSGRFAAEGLLSGTLRLGGVWDVVTPVRLAKRLEALPDDTPTVVHVHNFKDAATAVSALRLMRDGSHVRIVCTRHLVKPAKTSASALRLLRSLDAIIFVSRMAMDTFLSTSPDIDPARLHVVHNSITVDPLPVSATAVSGEGAVRLIYCGRISPEKGLDVLVRALASIRHLPWTLEVCGTGDSRAVMPVVRLARGLDIDSRIDWRGFDPDPLARMARADVAVLPTVAPESFGLVILEAFSQRLPVVTTDNGAQPEIMTDGVEGLLVPPSDTAALAAALETIINDRELRQQMSARAAEAYSTRFAYKNFYRNIIDVYNA